MDYMEPNMEIIRLNVKVDMIRTSNPGLDVGDDYTDEGGFDDTFGGL